jgi:hypothetical protein
MDDLDSILSGQGDAAPATNEQEQATQAAQAEGQGQQQEQQTGATEQDEQRQGQKMVPHEALHAEKQKVRRYTEEVSDFRRSNEALQRQVNELLQRIPVPQKEQQQPPDWFENPEAATQHVVQSELTPQLTQFNQALLAIAKDNAITRFTEDAVNEAETAFISAMQSGKLDQADFQKVVSSPNRYAAAVQWHKRQLAQAEVGDDPSAYRAKIEAEVLAKYGIQPGTQQQAQPGNAAAPSLMPSNIAGAPNVGARSGPAWSGPAPLNDIFNRARSPG